MSTIFTKIIDGDIPGRFVWFDAHPVVDGGIDQWVDAGPDLLAHLTEVSRVVGGAVRETWSPPRVGFMVAGFEVPHLHIHVFPAWDMAAFDFANAAKTVVDAEQDAHAERLRGVLRAGGHGDRVPDA